MTTEQPSPVRPPKKRLTSTAAGQSIFIGLWILGTLVVVAILAGAFLLGQSLGSDDAVESVAEEVEAPAIEFPVLSGIPVEPGQWAWDELRGGECISGFDGAFAEEFTVVGARHPTMRRLYRQRFCLLAQMTRTPALMRLHNWPGRPVMLGTSLITAS